MVYDDFLTISYWSPVKITRENIKRALSHAAPRYAKGKLVDLGCGTRPYEPLFAGYVESVFGVDHEETAGANYGTATRADLFADCTNTGLEAGSFDTLLSTQVIEHIPDTGAYIRECGRLLKPGGFGIFTVPLTWECHAEPHDYFRFTRYALRQLFTAEGFEIVELRPMEGAYATVAQTRIVSLLFGNDRMWLPARLFNAIRRRIVLPWLNWKGLHLDRIFFNDRLCLNYLLVVKKPL